MRWLSALLLTLVLVGCAEDYGPLTPLQCREVGVAVEDGDKPTGRIVDFREVQTVEDAMRECQKPFQRVYGCTLALGFYAGHDPRGEYRIVYIPSKFVREHEECHAYYEEGRHVQ